MRFYYYTNKQIECESRKIERKTEKKESKSKNVKINFLSTAFSYKIFQSDNILPLKYYTNTHIHRSERGVLVVRNVYDC